MSSATIWFDSLTGDDGDKFLTNFLGFDTFVFHADQDAFEKAPEAKVEGLGRADREVWPYVCQTIQRRLSEA